METKARIILNYDDQQDDILRIVGSALKEIGINIVIKNDTTDAECDSGLGAFTIERVG